MHSTHLNKLSVYDEKLILNNLGFGFFNCFGRLVTNECNLCLVSIGIPYLTQADSRPIQDIDIFATKTLFKIYIID